MDAAVTFAGFNTPSGVALFFGNGDGTFSPGPEILLSEFLASGPVVRDLNHDGNLDLVVLGANSNSVFVLLGHGDGTFNAPIAYGTGELAEDVQVGDVNGDHAPDIVVLNSKSVSVLLGRGDGTFGKPIYSAGLQTAYGLALGDLNGDGKLDVVVGAQEVGVLLGKGDGTRQCRAKNPLPWQQPTSMATITLI